MKLREVSIDWMGKSLHVGRLPDGLSVVYGENGAGKSNLSRFLKSVFHHNPLSDPSNGVIRFSNGSGNFELNQAPSTGIQIRNRDTHQIASSSELGASQVTPETYDSFFNFSFAETSRLSPRIAQTLAGHFSVPRGQAAFGNESSYQQWLTESADQRNRFATLESRIQQLESEKQTLLLRLEEIRRSQRLESEAIEDQLVAIASRISEIDLTGNRERLANIENELNHLRLTVENAKTRVAHIPEVPKVDRHTTLYQQLDEIDNQIRRWRHVQKEIQEQRIKLRDEMLIWNEMTLDSDSHPYHTAREILIALEAKVDQTERQAGLWSEVGDSRLDTTQLVDGLRRLCQGMREDVYGLCNELAEQYKHIRQKSAAAELKQLRRCYSEMGDSIKRLVEKREHSLQEIARIDPAGAEAIVRADSNFCLCAQHEGYLEARKRFVGTAGPAIQPTYQVVANNIEAELVRMRQLEDQKVELVHLISNLETELSELHRRRTEWTAQKDLLVNAVNHPESSRMASLESELGELRVELERLRSTTSFQVDLIPPNPFIVRASELLARMSEGDLQQVFLDDYHQLPELVVTDRFGKRHEFADVEPALQDQTCLCLALAVREQIAKQGVQIPTLIDDSFLRISGSRVAITLTMLKEFGDLGHQIIALTQHRYLVDKVPGIPLLELAPSLPVRPADPVRERGEPINAHFQANSQLADPTYRSSDYHQPSQAPRAYPLSKYPRSQPDYGDRNQGYTISYPFQNTFPVASHYESHREPNSGVIPMGALKPTTVSKSRSSSGYTPVAMQTGSDLASFTASIDDKTAIDRIGLFESRQLRAFSDHGIQTVGDFLLFDANYANSLGLLADQIDQWQSQIWLLSNVPGLRLIDAQVLVGCGVVDPSQLETSDLQQLFERISRYLASADGQRFVNRNHQIGLERIHGWQKGIQQTRSRWQNRPRITRTRNSRAVGTSQMAVSREREARPPRMHSHAESIQQSATSRNSAPTKVVTTKDKPRAVRTTRTRTSTTGTVKKSKLKFYLDLNDHIEAAPAIGPKTAERFEKVGVHTVAEFLKQTAESLASKLAYKRITEELVRQWQQQARLVCRIPNLRGHDAQLLVACGIIEPEELATMQPTDLFKIIDPFAQSKEGLKIIRNGKMPDLEEVTDWINWAANTRSLQAA
ncbi:MAG: DUF4332 domain-containing protein [Planctomycetota bacterium]